MKRNILRHKNYKKVSGITLIALVITIVVLLILTGITINTAFGENGIIAKTREAANKVDEATLKEQIELNKLYNDLSEILGQNEEYVEPKIKIIERNEDNIKVKVEGSDLRDYQFSLDGQNWSDAQNADEYTFTGLNKVFLYDSIIPENDIDDIEFPQTNKYTVYAKAKQKDGKEINLEPVKTSNVITIVGNEDTDYLEYEDLGNEIVITGIKPLYEWNIDKIISELGTDGLDEIQDRNILIPSYINGKPVTKVNINLWLEIDKNENKDIIYLLEDRDGKIISKITTSNGTMKCSFYNIGYDAYIARAISDKGMAKKAFNLKNPNQEEDMFLGLGEKRHDIILPPTIREIVIDETAKNVENELRASKVNNIKKVKNIDRYNLPVELNFGSVTLNLRDETIGNDTYGTGVIAICGKQSLNEIKNGYIIQEGNDRDMWNFEFIN